MYRILPVLKLSVLCSTVRSHSVKITAAKIVNYTQPINTNFVIKTILYSTVQSGEATFEEVKNVADNKSKNVLLIDVREPEELRETGVIPGSINIPLGHVKCALRDMSNEEFSRKYGIKKPDPSQPIIFSCKLGKRSANAQAILQQLGYKNVKNYLGGWLDWEEKTQNK